MPAKKAALISDRQARAAQRFIEATLAGETPPVRMEACGESLLADSIAQLRQLRQQAKRALERQSKRKKRAHARPAV